MKYLFLLTFLVFKAHAFNFSLEVQSNGTYKITEIFNIQLTFEELEIKLNDFSLLKQAQGNLVSGSLSKPSLNPTSKTSLLSSTETKLKTVVSKNGQSKDLNFNCSLRRYSYSLFYDCQGDFQTGDIKDLLASSSSKLHCSLGKTGLDCTRTYLGQSYKIDYIIYYRSAAQLAVSGAAEVLDADYKWIKLAEGDSKTQVEKDLLADSYYTNTIHAFWEPTVVRANKLKSNQKLIVSHAGETLNYQVIIP